ncbi:MULTISPECIES: cytochrome c biogenesis protein CcsA [unclassified Campylobacter]|uniref:cytochrome c biogenesis protein n=1 Tax=unclassified Campylobacter TaxID=2593542 RepID=UPI003D338911
MRNLTKTFFSMGSAIVLFLIFAIGSAVATIIERLETTQAAWEVVYGASWFALVQVLLGINLAYNIFAYKLINIKKLPSLLFHVSFLIILIGAGITRYLGFEGTMHIRENTESNTILTRGSFINFSTVIDEKQYSVSIPKELSTLSRSGFDLSLDLPGGVANLKYLEYVPKAGYKFVDDANGKAAVELVLSDETDKEEASLVEGDELELGPTSFALNKLPKHGQAYVLFQINKERSFFVSNTDITVFDGEKKTIKAGEEVAFDKAKLYTINGINFSIKFASPAASKKLVSTQTSEFDAIVAELKHNGESKEVAMFYNISEPVRAFIADKVFFVSWGAQRIKLPFSLYLKDFELKRYPGSNSPMGYASDVVVKDPNSEIQPGFDYRIYMNNVLDYAGYRFFQSSYDQDEKGTVLSVNRDPGKIPTYIGYFIMGLGFILNIINPGSRFRKLAHLVDVESSKKVVAALFALFAVFNTQNIVANDFLPHINAEHADKLGKILVQSPDGRMKPFDTVSRDILNKVHRKDSVNKLNSNQALLSIMIEPEYWRSEPVIALGSSAELKKELGIDPAKKFASFVEFFTLKDGQSEYKLGRFADVASRKHPGSRGTFDKDVIKIDERVNVFYIAFIGEIFKVFPKQNDPSNTWSSPYSAMMSFPPEESGVIANIMKEYFEAVEAAMKLGEKSSSNANEYTKKWSLADEKLANIKIYQERYGSSVIPSKSRVDMEILFNKVQIFERLTPVYLLAGFALLIFIFIKMLTPRLNINPVIKAIYIINLLAFIAHTAGLGLRWYISEHAPWSNSYESMVYIAWALGLSGIVFSKRSPIAIALTSMLAGITLFVAHLSWMDPQITTLVPVLQSYWLTIHVSVITASYGFLGLCSLLGFFVLVLIAMQRKNSENKEIMRNITEATRINEMAMILGISLLTLGNFLGGVWANESWGRYWGWDSKETWALISILVYAAVLHMRFVPKLNSQYAFAVASMFAYWSIIMTYFGVNFYLAGMHSYATGDPMPIPNFVYVTVAVMFALSIFAYYKRKSTQKL